MQVKILTASLITSISLVSNFISSAHAENLTDTIRQSIQGNSPQVSLTTQQSSQYNIYSSFEPINCFGPPSMSTFNRYNTLDRRDRDKLSDDGTTEKREVDSLKKNSLGIFDRFCI